MKSAFLLAMVLAAFVTLHGCGGGAGETAGLSVLSVGNGTEVAELDPHLTTGVPAHRVEGALFEGLVDMDPATMAPVPGAAASWEVSEDARVYTFTLQAAGKWSNGDAVTASDFVYSFQRILSPKLASEYAYLLHCIENARAFNEGRLEDFSQVGVTAIDDGTLEIRLENPTPYFLTMQTHNAWYPVHKGTVEQFGTMDGRGNRWTRAGNHVGNGAFRLAEWIPNDIIRVVKNEWYWDSDTVRLDGIYFFPIDNDQTEERSFRSGDLQITETIPLHKIAEYRATRPEVLNLHPYLGIYFYRVNTTRPPFTDVRVRQAFSLALDRETIAENVLKAGELPAHFFTPPDTAGFTSNYRVGYDVEKARRLLAEAGYPNGEGLGPVEILYNTSDAHKLIAEAIQGIWKANLNVDVRLLNQDWKVFLDSQHTLDYTLSRSSWIGDVVDPINFLELYTGDGGNNDTGWASPAYDALIQQVYREGDATRRMALMQEAEALLLEGAPIIPIYFYVNKYLMAPEMKGHIPNILGYRRWKSVYLEQGNS